jgi:hypothetical protein
MLYVLDDNDAANPQTKLLMYHQHLNDTYTWDRDLTSTVDGLLMNDVQPMVLDINGDQM